MIEYIEMQNYLLILLYFILFQRFSDEEKKDRSPYSWMPFGYGPRNCIGMRLAMVEVKIVAAHMLYNYKVEPCSKTQVSSSLWSTKKNTIIVLYNNITIYIYFNNNT